MISKGSIYTLNLASLNQVSAFYIIMEDRGIGLFDNMEVQILDVIVSNTMQYYGASKILINNQIVELSNDDSFWCVLGEQTLDESFTRQPMFKEGHSYKLNKFWPVTEEHKRIYPIYKFLSNSDRSTVTVLETDTFDNPTSVSIDGNIYTNLGEHFWSFACLGGLGYSDYDFREQEFFELTGIQIVQYDQTPTIAFKEPTLKEPDFDCEPILDISPTVKMCIKAPERNLGLVFAHLTEEIGEYSKATFRQDEVDECATGEAADVINCLIDTLWLNYRNKQEFELVNDKDLMCIVIDDLNEQIKIKSAKWAKAVL